MIVGVGLDVVVVARWARNLEMVQAKIFTEQELAGCADRVDRTDALAARFAAKEACLKALNTGIRRGALRQVEVVSEYGGAPQLRLSGTLGARARQAGVRTAHISLTHHEGIAAAVVILEGSRVRAQARTPEEVSEEPLTVETVVSGDVLPPS